MTKAVFETSTFADVMKRAAAVAPTRGDSFDKAAGVLLDVAPDTGTVVVRATDTAIFYMEALSFVKLEGNDTQWRLPSILLNGFASKLPIGSGNTITLDDEVEPPKVVLSCNRTKAKLNTLDPTYFPHWDAIEVDQMFQVADFGGAVKQVLWAASNNIDVLSGVAIDSSGVWTTDRFRAAHATRDIGDDWESRVVVPGKLLSKVLPDKGELSIGMIDGAFVVQPNEFTQIRTVIFDQPYPPVERLLGQEFDYKSFFDRDAFMEMLGRAGDFTLGSRQNALKMYIGRGEVALMMNNQEYGLFGDVLDCAGSAESHGRIEIAFKPENLRDAIGTYPNKAVEMQYNEDRTTPRKGLIKLVHGKEYAGVLQPLQDKEPDPNA